MHLYPDYPDADSAIVINLDEKAKDLSKSPRSIFFSQLSFNQTETFFKSCLENTFILNIEQITRYQDHPQDHPHSLRLRISPVVRFLSPAVEPPRLHAVS